MQQFKNIYIEQFYKWNQEQPSLLQAVHDSLMPIYFEKKKPNSYFNWEICIQGY